MPFNIVQEDITRMTVDAIVNAANEQLRMGGGVCGAIFRAAGPSKMQAACERLAPIKTGQAVITPGFALPSRYVIHAVGPVYDRKNPAESKRLLGSAYRASLRLAIEHDCKSLAFPLISSGIFGYPKGEALQVATAAIAEFLQDHDLDVYLCVLDKETIVVDDQLWQEISRYVANNCLSDVSVPMNPSAPGIGVDGDAAMVPGKALDHLLENSDESFSTTLLRLIDAKMKSDVEVYKRANIHRRLFSKIRSEGYLPSKQTVLALAVALELTLDETNDLLKRAGFALSPSQKLDIIAEYFIVNGRYNIFEINQVLFKYDQPLLGGV